MTSRLMLVCMSVISIMFSSGAHGREGVTESQNRQARQKDSTDSPKVLSPLYRSAPAPKANPTTPAKVALGKQLFFDPRLSGDNSMSCATCHLPEKAFADGLPGAKGHQGKILRRNTPTVLNVGFLSKFFWDGRVDSLEQQALGPIQSPDEMHQDIADLEKELSEISGYVARFQSIFKTSVTRDGIAKALSAFQRSLVTAPSPLDRYLHGDKSALSQSAKRGMELFTGPADCVTCHHGPMLTDEKFHRLRILASDKGLGGVSGERTDDFKFRTPSLRNVALTAPYMHDGSFETLADVVTFYFREVPTPTSHGLQLDVEPLFGLSFSDISDVVAFLESLTGEFPEFTRPQLP